VGIIGKVVVGAALVVVGAALVVVGAALVIAAPAVVAVVVEAGTPEETVGDISVGVESVPCSSTSSIRCFDASNSKKLDPPQADPRSPKTNRVSLNNIL
jgi:predicted secreted protein